MVLVHCGTCWCTVAHAHVCDGPWRFHRTFGGSCQTCCHGMCTWQGAARALRLKCRRFAAVVLQWCMPAFFGLYED